MLCIPKCLEKRMKEFFQLIFGPNESKYLSHYRYYTYPYIHPANNIYYFVDMPVDIN